MKTTKVVIVGGGFGGVKSALCLANKPGFEVQLISDNTHFEYHGALYRSAVGHSPMEVVIPLRDIFSHAHNVELVLDSATSIDYEKKFITSVTNNSYSYDKAILSLGNVAGHPELTSDQQPESLHDISSTIKLRKDLTKLFLESRQKIIRIAIVGGGISGVELAGEIQTFAASIAKQRAIKIPRVKIVVIEKSERILPSLNSRISRTATKRLHALGIEVHTGIKVESCNPGKLQLSAGELATDLTIWTAGSKLATFYCDNPAVFVLSERSRVVVDDQLQPQGRTDIYVIGDNADTKFSGMAQTAIADAEFVAKNLIREQAGVKAVAYKAKKPVYSIKIGPKWAVVESAHKIATGKKAYLMAYRSDRVLFRKFAPYAYAIRTWRQANKLTLG